MIRNRYDLVNRRFKKNPAQNHKKNMDKMHGVYTWNPNDPYFGWKFGLLLERFKAQNRGQTGSRYACVYIYIYITSKIVHCFFNT